MSDFIPKALSESPACVACGKAHDLAECWKGAAFRAGHHVCCPWCGGLSMVAAAHRAGQQQRVLYREPTRDELRRMAVNGMFQMTARCTRSEYTSKGLRRQLWSLCSGLPDERLAWPAGLPACELPPGRPLTTIKHDGPKHKPR